jgi:hypothetical protein
MSDDLPAEWLALRIEQRRSTYSLLERALMEGEGRGKGVHFPGLDFKLDDCSTGERRGHYVFSLLGFFECEKAEAGFVFAETLI